MLTLLKNWIKQKTFKKSDTSSTPRNANEQGKSDYSNNNERVIRTPIDDTPFEIVRLTDKPKNKDHFIAIGNQRVTELTSKEELVHQIATGNWDLQVKVMVHIAGRMIDGALDMMKKN